MCERNKNNEGSDGKSSLLSPLLCQGPKGVSKIFILTPEILNTLGIAGHLDIRKASRDEPKSINISTLNLQQSSGVADHQSSSTSVRIVPEVTSSTSEVKKRKADSIFEKIADETPKTPKSAIENSTQLKQRLNGINKKISKHPNNEKESISCTLKTKKIRRRSSAVDIRREESINKQAGNESKNESEPVVSGVRSSKRVAKPKKFDDYVMTDVFSNKSRTSDDIDDTPISAKRQSRKSSGNSSKAERRNSREKAATEKIDKVEETKSNKATKAMDQRSSIMRKSLKNYEICSTVSETKINVDKSKVVRTCERRNSRDKKPSELVSDDESISEKEAEPFGQESSGTITGPADEKIFLPVQPSKMNVSNVKIIKTYQKPKIKDKIAPASVELGDKAESKRAKGELATSAEEISKSENISSTRKDCAKQPEKQINVKAVNSYEKPTAKENIGGDIVQPEETKKSIEKDERTSSMSGGSETSIIVSSTEIRTIETLESKCFEKPREMESQIDSPKSPVKNEEFKAPEPKLTKLRLKGRLITISKSKLTKFSGPLSVSKPLPPIFQDKDDPNVAKSHLPRSPDKKEDADFSKIIEPSFQDEKVIGTLQTDPTMNRDNKKEASLSAPIPSKALIEKQAGGSKMIMPISQNDNKETSIPKTISPGCLTKKEIVSNPNITKSANETAASCSKPDKPKFWIKKRISAAKPNIPKSLNKKEVVALTPEVPISVNKKEIKTSIPKVSISPDKQEDEASISEVPISANKKEIKTSKQKAPISADNKEIKSSIVEVSISPDLKEVGALIPEVPICPVHKEYRSSASEVQISPDRIGTNASIMEVPMLLDVKQTRALLPEVPTSSDKNETDVSISQVPISFVNIEVTTSKSELPTSPAKKDVSSSIPEVAIFFVEKDVTISKSEVPISFIEKDVMISKSAALTSSGKKEATTSILEAPISSDKEAQDNIPNLAGNDAINATDILNIDTSTEISLSSPTSSNVEQEIILKNFSITGDSTVEELDVEKKIPLEETPDEVSEYRVPRKMGKKRSRKPRISFEAPEDQPTNIKVENTVPIAGSSFDTFAKSTCRTKKSTQKSKDDTDAKGLHDAESKQHEILNCIPVDDLPKEVSELRIQRKKGKRRSIKPQLSVDAPEDQVTNIEVEIEVPTAASSFDTFVENTCQSKKSTQKSEEADAKDPNEAESEKHKILFKSPDEEDQDSIPNTIDDGDKFSNILDSNPSTKVEPISSSILDVEEEIVLENFPIGEESAIQVMEAENCIPLQRAPKTKSVVRVPRKKGRPRKPPIAIERLDDEETDQQVENVISAAPDSFDTFVKGNCRTEKCTKKSGDDTDAKNLSEAESKEHEILTKSPHEDEEENLSNIFEDADNPPDILDSNPSTEIQATSQAHWVVEEKIVDKNAPTEEKSVVEVMEVKNCIPLQDEPKKVSEVPVPRKRGRPRKLPIVVEPPEDKKTDQQVENVISTTANSFDTFVEGACRTKKPVQRSKDEIDGKGLSEDSEGEFENDEIVLKRSRGRPGGSTPRGKRGRGRGRGKTRQRVDFEYVPREKSSGTKQSHATESTEVGNSEGPNVDDSQSADVECGKCKEKMMKSEWSAHNLSKHNNMGWRNGEKEPDFSDEKFLRSVLMAALKKKKKKNSLTCETCGIGKRSANGFISHLQFCGKTEEERQSLLLTCPICGNVMMPSSMEMHERFHRQMDAATEEQKNNAPTDTGRGKRKAAEKAATKIAEFTDLVREEEVAPSKKRRREEVMNLIEKPRYMKGTPNRWRGIWKNEINTKGAASCRQPGCKFTEDSVEALCNHNITCPCTPRQNFVCKICTFSSESQKQVVKHVKAKHDPGSSTGQQEDSDFEGEDSSSSSDSGSDHSTDDTPPKSSVSVQKPAFEKRQRPKTNVKFLDDLSHIDPKWHTSYSPAIRWTMEFECENYRLRLFKDLMPNVMKLLNDKDTLGYLPELSCSMRTKEAKKRTDDKPPEWVSWKRFEGRGAEGIPTFFTGGPIWALAWLPIPAPLYDHSVDQYVAVSTHPTMQSVYVVGKAHVGKNLIQIWNVGHLEHNKTTDHVVPTLAYGVAHDKGTIWCLEWCPSGCYEHSSFLDENEAAEENQDRKRMGLLAAACSDGCVHVFSLPFPDGLHFKKNDHATNSSLPIYETKPILTLIASTTMYEKGEQNWQCTKLNWSKELGHDTIIAGFSNGYVAMWDLNSATPLFVTRRGETTLIDAFHHFYAHGHAVSFVQMVPYGGKRFFITSGYDRLSKVWDLEDTSYPLNTTKRGIALDGAWLNHWPGYLTAYDDVMVHGHTYLMSLRQPGLKIFPLLPSNSPTFSVEVSDYGNSIGHGTMAGEVLVMFPHHLWNHRDMERDVPRKRWLASSSEVVDIAATGSGKEKIINSCLKRKVGKDYVYMPETYDDCRNRFGIIFRDNLNRSKRDGHRKQSRPPCSERMSAVQIEQYPFASANRVSWNPNAWSYLWLCVGYQNGLVRFLNFNSVAVDKELRKLLPSHAKSMLDVSRRDLKFENDPVNYDPSHTSDTRSNS